MNQEPKIYIASKTKHAQKWIDLRSSGVNIISSWIDEAGAGETVSMELLAVQCVHQSKECDAMIVYREEGDYLKGAFIEMGVAITFPLKPIILVGPALPPGSVFTHLPNVFAADTVEEAVKAIRKNHRPVSPLPSKEAAEEYSVLKSIPLLLLKWLNEPNCGYDLNFDGSFYCILEMRKVSPSDVLDAFLRYRDNFDTLLPAYYNEVKATSQTSPPTNSKKQ